MAVTVRRIAGLQIQVVFENLWMDRVGRHIYKVCPRIPEADQQKEKSFLIEARCLELLEFTLIEGERRHDDGGVRLLFARGQALPHLGETRLELLEGSQLVMKGEARSERRFRHHSAGQRIQR